MDFVVTGGAGFIGSYLTKHLVSEGHDVTVVDNLSRGKLTNLKEVDKKINFVELDILDYDELRDTLQDADGIFHQAALGSVPESYKEEDKYRKVNVTGTENIFKIGKEFQIKTVYASSSSVYGNVKKIPIVEDTERKPLNPYGCTKLEGEILAEKYARSGAQIIGLRYLNVFGARQNPNYAGVITHFLDNICNGKSPVIFGDGMQVRDFIFVQDVVMANLAAMMEKVKCGFFNIGSGNPLSIKDLAYLMIKISGQTLEPKYADPRPGDAKMSAADISHSKKLLGWRPETTLEEGLRTLF